VPTERDWERARRCCPGCCPFAAATGDCEVALSEADLDGLAEPEPPPLPDAFALVATVAAASPEALERGDFRVVVRGADGPSGARLLARFC
jgi:hypothetical protein